MRPVSSALVGAVAFLALGTTAGYADVIDPLHGACAGCIDNGTNTPLVSQPFSFSASPGPQTGTLLLEVLEPSTAATNNFMLTGTSTNTGAINTTGTLLPGVFNSGDLAAFVGLSGGASPANPIGGFGAGGVTSYDVFQVNLGTQTVAANGGTCVNNVVSGCNPLLDITSLPRNSYIVAFLEQPGGNIATALSGALLVPAPAIGHGLFVLLAVGGVLFGSKLLEGLKKRQLHVA